MIISTHDSTHIIPYLKQIHVPQQASHKGQNGKVLVIGGSSLFHGAVLWSAEAVAHIVDMVHVASTRENNEIIRAIKIMWQAGIVVAQKDIETYVHEDDVILIGNGMMRGTKECKKSAVEPQSWEQIRDIKDEGAFTKELVYFLLSHFPNKQFVLDAGALQMMDPKWLLLLHKKAIITPHQKEFQALFGIDLSSLSLEEKEIVVQQTAKKYTCIILLKTVDDIISDGENVIRLHGGNAGLTKGGTGDILAGIVSGLSATSDPFVSAIVTSYLLKKTAEDLFLSKGNWYTANDILSQFPEVFHALTKKCVGV